MTHPFHDNAIVEIKAVIRPAKLEPLRLALRELDEFPGMSVTKVEGCSAKYKDHARSANIKQELLDYSPKVLVTIVAPVETADAICATILAQACTGRIGDGLLWTSPVARAWRIAAADPDRP
jgi:nitrogen regulatory protein P-II 1